MFLSYGCEFPFGINNNDNAFNIYKSSKYIHRKSIQFIIYIVLARGARNFVVANNSTAA